MPDQTSLATRPAPAATRPLLGLTVLVVEDSRYASDALRLMCLRSGARIRRADSLHAAWRHLRVYRPSVLMVDAGLPDGSGLDLVAEMAVAKPRIGVILGMSGDAELAARAQAAGADGFLVKPLTSLALFRQEMLRHLPQTQGNGSPGPLPGPCSLAEDRITPDPVAYHDDLCHMRNVLDDNPDDAVLRYAAQFLAGVARDAGDVALARAAGNLIGTDGDTRVGHVKRLLDTRLAERVAL